MVLVLLQDRENAGWSLVTGLAAGYGRRADRHSVAEHHELLRLQVDDDERGAVVGEPGRPDIFARLELPDDFEDVAAAELDLLRRGAGCHGAGKGDGDCWCEDAHRGGISQPPAVRYWGNSGDCRRRG